MHLGKDARLQKPPTCPWAATLELRRPGGVSSDAGMSSPCHHSVKLEHDPEVALHLPSSYGKGRVRKSLLFFRQKGH